MAKHSDGHIECPACDGLRMRHGEALRPELLFRDAFEIWLSRQVIRDGGFATDARYISDRTEWDYCQYARALEKMFCSLKLCEIHDGHLREYHRARAFADGAWKEKAGANRIRKEVNLLLRIMTAAGAWTKEQDDSFQRLQQVEADVPRAMSEEQEKHFLATANSQTDWHFILAYSVAALQTTASTNEMRELRIGDVSLEQGIVQVRVRSAKNKFRIRSIPIESDQCRWAFEWLLHRAAQLGCERPSHFLFPYRTTVVSYDGTKPMSDSGLRKKWDEVRKAAKLDWLRPYDLRHTGITRMAENGVPVPVILSFAGHISQRMQQHYTQVSMMAKRKAAAAAWSNAAAKPKPMSTVRAFPAMTA